MNRDSSTLDSHDVVEVLNALGECVKGLQESQRHLLDAVKDLGDITKQLAARIDTLERK